MILRSSKNRYKWGGPGGAYPSYTRRAKVGNETRIGWTLDSRTCQFVRGGATSVNDFEILVRKTSKAFKLDLTN